MSRDYKNLKQGCYYHVYNRGHNYQVIFADDQDFRNFLKRLKIILSIYKIDQDTPHRKGNLSLRPLPKDSFELIAYCLMPNHFHFLIKQNSKIPISALINRLMTSYVKYFNARNGRIGSLFQDTFKAKLVENDSYLAYLTSYIHNNPDDLAYPYSSFMEYRNGPEICTTRLVLGMFNNDPKAYMDFVVKSKPAVKITLEGEGNL